MKKAAAPGVSIQVPAETLDWLLEPGNPSVRFFTLRDVLGKPASATEVKQA